MLLKNGTSATIKEINKMTDYQFLDDVYDILAQNEQWATETVKQNITDMIDHVDANNGHIMFRNKDGKEFMLKLVSVYAPSELVAKEGK